MSFMNKAIRAGYKAPSLRGINDPLPEFSIRLHADGSIVRGLTIEDCYGGPRDLSQLPPEHRKGSVGNLVEPGHVNFITRNGKRWVIKLSEFSFLINGRELDKTGDPKPKRKTFEPVVTPDHYVEPQLAAA